MDLWAHQTITDNRDVLLSAFATASYLKEIYVCTRTEHRPKKPVAQEIKKPHFAVAQYPLDLKSKWKP